MEQNNENRAMEPLSPAVLATKVLTEPATAFENIKAYPNWLFPILLSLIVSLSFVYYTQDISLEYQKKSILESEQLTEEQKDAALERFEEPGVFMTLVMPSIGVVVSVFLIPALMAAILMLFGNFAFGGNAEFKTLFSVAAWGGMVGVVEAIVKLPLMVIRHTYEVYTSLALLLEPADSKSIIFKLFNAVDLFSIWKIIVFSIAFSVVYKFSKGKSYGTIISLYVVYTFIIIGLGQLFNF